MPNTGFWNHQRILRSAVTSGLVAGLLIAIWCRVGFGAPILFDTSFLSVWGSALDVAAADVNGDGYPDLIGVHQLGNTLCVVLNSGDGTFPPAQGFITTAQEPTDVAVADLNRDGRPDIGISNYGSNTVSVYLGNGDGTFTLKSHFQPAGQGPRALAFGYVDGDSILDLVVANALESTVSVAFGAGNGTFGSKTSYPAGTSPFAVVLGDLDNDQHPDIVSANFDGQTISVLLNNGDGTFGSRTDTYIQATYDCTVADLDGDGNQDLAVSQDDAASSSVAILWGHGDGTFSPPVEFATGLLPLSVIATDLNRDGRLDLVTGNCGNLNSTITVLFGQPGRQFGNRADWRMGNGPYSLAAADFNRDSWMDVYASSGLTMAVSLNRGAGTFGGSWPWNVPERPYCVASVDVNADQRIDILVGTDVSVSVYLRGADGGYTKQGDYGFYARSLATGDFNNDGITDVVTANGTYNTTSVLLGLGDGSFGARTDFPVGQNAYCVAAADLNYDRSLDFVVTDKGSDLVSVMYGDGTGTCFARTDYVTGSRPTGVGIGDVNGDGAFDLVVGDGGYPPAISVFLGHAAAGLGGRVDYPAGIRPEALFVGDLNGDRKADLAVANYAESSVTIHLGTGTGAFPSFTKYLLGGGAASSVVAGDANGDGVLDLAVGQGSSSMCFVVLLLGNGDGTFGQRIDYGTGMEPRSVCLRDLDGDHTLDIVTGNRGESSVSILRNISGIPTTAVPEPGDGAPRLQILRLGQNYPNPFWQSTTLPYSLTHPALVRQWIHDPLGRIVARLSDAQKASGNYSLTWDGCNSLGQPVGPGVYFMRLEAGGQAQTRKVVVAR